MSGRSLGRASALVALAACCFGSISVLTVVGTRAGVSLPTLLAWRYLPGALLLLLAAGPTRARVAPRVALRALVVGGLGQALVSFVTLSALRWITAATLGFLFYTYPAWVALFAALRGTERVDRRRGIALALSFSGIALIVGAPAGGSTAGGTVAWPGVLLGLAAALIYALYVPFLHGLEAETSPAVASAYVTGGAGVAFLAAALGTGTFAADFTPPVWAAIATLSLLCTFVGFLAFLRGLAVLGPVRTAIVSTIEPFWTAILGAALLAQGLTGATLAGGALIAAAVMLLQLPARRAA